MLTQTISVDLRSAQESLALKRQQTLLKAASVGEKKEQLIQIRAELSQLESEVLALEEEVKQEQEANRIEAIRIYEEQSRQELLAMKKEQQASRSQNAGKVAKRTR